MHVGRLRTRRSSDAREHHILDPRTGVSADAVASVTVVAPTAMLADALATAAFVLGPAEGIRLLERHGVDGLIVTPALERSRDSRGLRRDEQRTDGRSAIPPNAERPAHDRPRAAFVAVAAPAEGIATRCAGLLSAVVVAGLIDASILRMTADAGCSRAARSSRRCSSRWC